MLGDPRDLAAGARDLTRRHFFGRTATGLGALALADLLRTVPPARRRARRIVWLFQSGAPSQLDLFDEKPLLVAQNGQPLPDHVRGGQRLTGMSAQQASIPLAGSVFRFARHGEAGATVSELLPHTAAIADKLCFVKSMYTEAINHDPAITFVQTGSQNAGRPSFGAWASYGLGSDNDNLPAFVVMITPGKGDQPLYGRLWGSGFLPSRHQGVQLRAGASPLLYLANPEGVSADGRRDLMDTIARLDRIQQERELDPEIESRIAQYEMAAKLQSSVPEVTDLTKEPESVFALYGPDARKPGTFAHHCLLARRLLERGVRFVQLYHQGWDQHDNLPNAIRGQCAETDQPSAALVRDLEARGLLDDTLVVWGGEFGRTAYSQGQLTPGRYGRDHHPRCFTIWMAGGGVRAGTTYGRTDEYGYNIADADGNALSPDKSRFCAGAVHVHDLQATILKLLGVDHEELTFAAQGRRFRLTDVHGHVIHDLLA